MIYYEEERLRLLVGDARELAAEIEPGSVDCIVTSPPYWAVRDYGTATWEGGDPECDHRPPHRGEKDAKASTLAGSRYSTRSIQAQEIGVGAYKKECGKCGATRIDDQLGLEETDQEYIDQLVRIVDAYRPVLAETGVLWLNLGDTRGSGQVGRHDALVGAPGGVERAKFEGDEYRQDNGPRALCQGRGLFAIPWRTALALQSLGWAIVSEVIWHKTNGMPESAKRRPTTTHEHLFLLAPTDRWTWVLRGETRLRTVWSGGTAQYGGNHAAVMPLWLAERAILHTTKPGALVLDPFCGTGTSLIAARRNGRRAVGIDLSLDSLGQALRRIRAET